MWIEILIRSRKAINLMEYFLVSLNFEKVFRLQKRRPACKKEKENHPHWLPHNSTWSHETPFEIIEPQFLTIMYFEPEP